MDDYKTCGEISCEECNDRYEKALARIAELEAELERLRSYMELVPCLCQRGYITLCLRCEALGKERS